MELNQHLDGLALGGIRRFTALAQERGDCILLTLGEPEFDTPAPIRRACREALDRGLTHYTENRGSLLREAVPVFFFYNAVCRGLPVLTPSSVPPAGRYTALRSPTGKESTYLG